MCKKPICYVYILRCSDDSLYTGWTNDLDSRINAHNGLDKNGAPETGKPCGAKYTRSRRPVTLAYYEEYPDRSSAMKREAEIKKMTSPQKKALIKSQA